MPRRILASALTAALLAALAFSPAAESAGTLAHRVATALRVARAADHRSRLALAQAARVTAGPAGAPGSAGQAGSAGANGHDGASVTGPAGRDGTSASMPRPVSASNDAGVFVGTSPTVITHTSVTAAGWLMVSGTAQLLAEGPAEQARCHLDVDSREVSDMYAVVAAGGSSEVAIQAVTDTGPGSHDVALTCSKSAVLSSLEVPLGRARLSVVTG